MERLFFHLAILAGRFPGLDRISLWALCQAVALKRRRLGIHGGNL